MATISIPGAGSRCLDASELSLAVEPESVRRWYAVFTVPQNEAHAAKQLELRSVEVFYPTYETVRLWKNRQRVHLKLPLFPCYLFVRIHPRERGRVLQVSGVLRIVGNHREMSAVPDSVIEMLRSGLNGIKFEPYKELVVGQKVWVKDGPLQGIHGVLTRKNASCRFVITLELINQHAAAEIDARSLVAALE